MTDVKNAMRLIDVPLIEREGVIDRCGVTLLRSALKNMDGQEVPICLHFDVSKQIGVGVLNYKDGKGLGAKLSIMKEYEVKGLVPCLGFRVAKSRKKKDYVEYYGKAEAMSIGMCKENTDAGILPV